jgi:cyclopropane-fatty-acyl-phospholipid synthase
MDKTYSPDITTGKVSLPLQIFMYMLKGVRYGTLDVTLPNGTQRHFAGALPGKHGVLNIHSDALIKHVLKNGEVGFGEAYLDGCWSSPDLSSLLEVLYINEPYYKGPYEKNFLATFMGWVAHKLKANTKKQAKENISYHYDLGNEFYKMWLDDTMAYSSAMFIEPNQTLQDAQIHKFELIYDRLNLQPEHTLLEIGSGWGGFAIYAAQHSGCKVHSITLSEEQLKEARIRAEKAGLADKIHFELRDYRDVTETYDRVVSIEMYEAVGKEFWLGYFQTIQKALKTGGVAVIQGITIDESVFEHYQTKQDFIQKYIFPGGMLASPTEFKKIASQAGLQPKDDLYYATDYADTLAYWHRNVLAVSDKIVQQFDERFLRMWRYYLSYCEAGFRLQKINLMHISLHK